MYKFYKGYKGVRKLGYDYSKPGLFFVTIDCHLLECRFGHVQRKQMVLSDFGKIALKEWDLIPIRFTNTRLHEFQIMPNHLHGIIEIQDGVQYSSEENVLSEKLKSLSDIIGAYKSFVSNECLVFHKETFKLSPSCPILGKIWHRSFHDKIILDRAAHKSISRYIRNNPKKWTNQ